MTDKDRLEEIKYILESPGEVFFGNMSSEGIVSQDVADAEPYFLWMAKRIDELEQQNKLYREAMGRSIMIIKSLPRTSGKTKLCSILIKALEGEE